MCPWQPDAPGPTTTAAAGRLPAVRDPRRRAPDLLERPGDPRRPAGNPLDVAELPGVLAGGDVRPGQLHRPRHAPGQPGRPVLVHPRRCLLYTSPSPRDGLLSRMP